WYCFFWRCCKTLPATLGELRLGGPECSGGANRLEREVAISEGEGRENVGISIVQKSYEPTLGFSPLLQSNSTECLCSARPLRRTSLLARRRGCGTRWRLVPP